MPKQNYVAFWVIVAGLVCGAYLSAVYAGIAVSQYQLAIGTPLMLAAQKGDIKKVEELLDTDTNPNEQNSHGATALAFAASEGKIDVVRLLLRRGANSKLCASGNMCPLWYAVSKGSFETVKTLIEAGADVNKHPGINALEHPILHKAAAHGRTDIVRLLIDHGVDIDFNNTCWGNTALAMAVRCGATETARMLLEAGADISAVTKTEYYGGKTAFEIAKKEGHTGTVQLVEQHLVYEPRLDLLKLSFNYLLDELYRDQVLNLTKEPVEVRSYLEGLSEKKLKILRNAIFARKNYRFETAWLTEYFQKRFEAYKPLTKKVRLTKADKDNIKLLVEMEESKTR